MWMCVCGRKYLLVNVDLRTERVETSLGMGEFKVMMIQMSGEIMELQIMKQKCMVREAKVGIEYNFKSISSVVIILKHRY